MGILRQSLYALSINPFITTYGELMINSYLKSHFLYRKLPLLGLIIIWFSCADNALSASKALLIGTGEYQNPEFNLTGINLDLAIMKRTARRLGFHEENIATLTGSSVTKANIVEHFNGFLSNDVSPSDSILIYYSGHGVQITDRNNDEADNRDEALTLYTLRGTTDGYDGIFLDDELSAMLASLPGRNVIAIVDACHSGTVTRSITNTLPLVTQSYGTTIFQPKALPYRGKKNIHRSVNAIPVTTLYDENNVVTLSAAQDNQKALATNKGSIFTLALAEAIATTQGNISARQLIKTATNIISDRVDQEHVFKPNLSGTNALFDNPLRINSATLQPRDNWNAAMQVASISSDIEARLNKTLFYNEEAIQLRFNAPSDGYLNVIAIDEHDSLILLYPNRYSPENKVTAGWTTLPGTQTFEWEALPPWGRNLIMPVFSQTPYNLFESSLQKNRYGITNVDYAIPSLDALQKIGFGGVRNTISGIAANTLQFGTCEHEGSCP